jgi:two-component system nitrogen regulation response regulator GlnG
MSDRTDNATLPPRGDEPSLRPLGQDVLVLTIVAHVDADRVGEVCDLSVSPGLRRLSRDEPLFQIRSRDPSGRPGRSLESRHLSRRPITLRSTNGRGLLVDCHDTSTLVEVDRSEIAERVEIDAERLAGGVLLSLSGGVVLALRREPATAQASKSTVGSASSSLIGGSPGLRRVRAEIAKVARSNVPVLIRGETGTGKELVARAIHDSSARAAEPFVAVNMAAIPESLAASEMFGAAKGAFSGANASRRGFFARAHGGTLFLDEIGETPTSLQPVLLRALESGEIQRVGAGGVETVDVRVITATDKDLEAAVRSSDFRRPLLHRLAGFQLFLPPLRDRVEDLGVLFYHFLREELAEIGRPDLLRLEGDNGPWVTPDTVARLAQARWPGNVRQLRNLARQAVLACHDLDRLRLSSEIERAIEMPSGDPPLRTGPLVRSARSYRDPADVSSQELIERLKKNDFRIKSTARDLGLSRTSLYALIDQTPEIRRARDLSAEEIEECRALVGDDLQSMASELQISTQALRLRLKELGLARDS